MTIDFLNMIYFALPLLIFWLIVKYIFNVNVAILWPSVILLFLFVVVAICSPYTSKYDQSVLYSIFCVIQVLMLGAGILLMTKQGIVWKHFFISLPFQFFYWVQLFYYGCIYFTHKF